MNKEILDFYRCVSVFTNYDPYGNYLKNLTNNIFELAKLINFQCIHRNALVRSYKNHDENYYIHGVDEKGLAMLARSLFFDFHALMNDEISYRFFPPFLSNDTKFAQLTDEDLQELDELAYLMLDLDRNFYQLKKLFDNNKKYRVLNSPLVGDGSHLEL